MGEVKAISLQSNPISAEKLCLAVKDNKLGGVVMFSGDIRDQTGEIATSHLEYEAHESMALHQMSKIAAEAAEKWDANVAVAHRIGLLLPGETAVVCAAACAHRAAAFECCRFLIDRIKEDVPIWKKENGPDGEAWVSGNSRVE
jgi:molybdopterin synthase catalytic subunit